MDAGRSTYARIQTLTATRPAPPYTFHWVRVLRLLLGGLCEAVYNKRINDINYLKQRITEVIHSVTSDILTRVWEELEYRLDVCRASNGSHIELHWIGTNLGEFSFHLVKMSHFYLVSLISCDRSKVQHDFTDTRYLICYLISSLLQQNEIIHSGIWTH